MHFASLPSYEVHKPLIATRYISQTTFFRKFFVVNYILWGWAYSTTVQNFERTHFLKNTVLYSLLNHESVVYVFCLREVSPRLMETKES